ncbi:MAG: HNH endonuclease [Chloroflexota bacterium]|nr:HNH endonuclease [Chloroflexota bacterium]
MPRRPRRPCPHPGCPRFRPCALHPATPYRGSSTALGYGAAWRKVSTRVLAEEPICPGYPPPCGDLTEVVDHIQSRRRGGTDERTNLRAYCRGCHSRKTVAEDGGWGHAPHERRGDAAR